MTERFRWGILGAGKISGKFAAGVGAIADAEVAAVASRELASAERFAAEHGVARAVAPYEALVADPAIDAIYIGTINTAHFENVRMCIEAGKPVLCEKPLMLNARQGAEIVALARARGVFLMEAMWTRFLPVIVKVRQWLAEGRIGEVRMLQAAFGHKSGKDPDGRLLNPAMGGGSLLDVGIYPLALASMVFGGPPVRAVSLPRIGATGVDEDAAFILQYDSGALAVLASGVKTRTAHDAMIAGERGNIHIHTPFWRATSASLEIDGEEPVTFAEEHRASGLEYEAEEVMARVRAGETQSPVMPLDESLQLLETMDGLRRDWGLRYPGE